MAYLVIALCFGLAGGIVGRYKGSSFLLWFVISGAVPFLGLLTAALYRSEHDELRGVCPRCGRTVAIHDAICTRCGEELEFTGYTDDPGPRDAQLERNAGVSQAT